MAKSIPAAVVPAFLVGAFLAPPDPISQRYYLSGGLAVTLALAALVVYRSAGGESVAQA